MYKTITVFKNIRDLEEFRKLYLEQLLPRINNLPGCVCTDVTSVTSVSQEMSGELGDIQYMIETHFESLEIMNEVLSSPEIGQHMMRALQETPGDLFFFTGNTARIYSDTAKQKFNVTDKESSVMDDYSNNQINTYRLNDKPQNAKAYIENNDE